MTNEQSKKLLQDLAEIMSNKSTSDLRAICSALDAGYNGAAVRHAVQVLFPISFPDQASAWNWYQETTAAVEDSVFNKKSE